MAWFADNEAADTARALATMERLAGLVFDLRRELFWHTEHHHAHEREWETEAREKQRERANEEKLMEWDNETLRLILGTSTGASEPA